MPKIEQSIKIGAPAEKIGTYLLQPDHLVELWPSLVEVSNVRYKQDGGSFYCWVYKVAGITFRGDGEDVEVITDKRIVSQITGEIECELVWQFEEMEEGTTNVYLSATYEIPVPLPGKMAETIVARANERELEILLYNLMIAVQFGELPLYEAGKE